MPGPGSPSDASLRLSRAGRRDAGDLEGHAGPLRAVRARRRPFRARRAEPPRSPPAPPGQLGRPRVELAARGRARQFIVPLVATIAIASLQLAVGGGDHAPGAAELAERSGREAVGQELGPAARSAGRRRAPLGGTAARSAGRPHVGDGTRFGGRPRARGRPRPRAGPRSADWKTWRWSDSPASTRDREANAIARGLSRRAPAVTPATAVANA
jgi:hypothetical protein